MITGVTRATTIETLIIIMIVITLIKLIALTQIIVIALTTQTIALALTIPITLKTSNKFHNPNHLCSHTNPNKTNTYQLFLPNVQQSSTYLKSVITLVTLLTLVTLA